MNKAMQKALKQLELYKDKAIAEINESFPEKFYFVAEFFLKNQLFKQIIDEIDEQCDEEHAAYNQMLVGILRCIDHILQSVIKYIQGKQVTTTVLDEINFLSVSKGESLVEIFKKLWSIQKIFKELSETKHLSFIHRHESQVIFLGNKIKKIGDENERLRTLENNRSWGYLRRFKRIVNIYNSKAYKTSREELFERRETTLIWSIATQYQGLSRCIYPGEDPLFYGENFGMQEDKRAIQEIYAIAKHTLEYKSSEDQTIQVLDEKKDMLRILVGKTEKSSISRKSNRGKLVLFFSQKKNANTDQLIKILEVETVADVINAKNDLNKLFNEYGIKAALQEKNIPSNFGKKAEISRNPKHW